MKSIIVSSPRAGTGKTTIACFVAMNLATRGKSILFLDASENLNGYLFFVACEKIPKFDSINLLKRARAHGLSDELTKFEKGDGLDVEFTNNIGKSLKSSNNKKYDYIIVDTDYTNGPTYYLAKFRPNQFLLISDGTNIITELTTEESKYLYGRRIASVIISNNNKNNTIGFEPPTDSPIVNFKPEYDQYYDEISYSLIQKFDQLGSKIL